MIVGLKDHEIGSHYSLLSYVFVKPVLYGLVSSRLAVVFYSTQCLIPNPDDSSYGFPNKLCEATS